MPDGTSGTTTKTERPMTGHFWNMTHPNGEDPTFPIEQWAQRQAEQPSVSDEPADKIPR